MFVSYSAIAADKAATGIIFSCVGIALLLLSTIPSSVAMTRVGSGNVPAAIGKRLLLLMITD